MAKINVVNLGGKEGRRVRTARRSVLGRDQRRAAVGVGEALPRRAAPGHRVHQDARPGFRRRPQAVEAEGHGPRAHCVDPQPALALRRHGPRTEAAQLRVRVPAEEADGRAALGDCGEDCRRQVDGGRVVRRRRGRRPSSSAPRWTSWRRARPRCWSRPAASSARSSIWARAICEGVELVLSSEVHPYDLLRYEHAVFSKDAIEALQETLKKFVSKRSKAAAQKEVA